MLLIILPLSLSLLLQIPAVQNFVVHKAAEAVSRKLETTVSIDRVRIGLLGKVRVDGFYVEDYQRDTLLYAGRVDAYITGLGIFGGGIVLSRGELSDVKLYLRETPDGEMNIKQVVARFANPKKKKKSNFELSLRKASIRNMDFCLDRLSRRNPPYGIDFGHMHLYGITGSIDDFTIRGSDIFTTIHTLSARERSGFVLNRFEGQFYLAGGHIGLQDASIITPQSNIQIPYLTIEGSSWADFKDFTDLVSLNAAFRRATISTDDIAYFAPRLRDWHTVVSNADLEVSGPVADMQVKIKSMQVGPGTFLSADAALKGLPDFKNTHFDVTVSRLSSTARDAEDLLNSIAGKKLPGKLSGILRNSGRLELTARFQGMLSAFDMKLGASTGVGAISCDVQMQPLKGGRQSIRGNFSTRELKLGELLGNRKLFGNASLSAHVDGVVGKGFTDAKVSGVISRLGFNGYVYDSLRLDGRVSNKEFDGRIAARDPNLNFDFSGLMDLNDSVPRYDFTLDLRRADLAKLHLNRRDSVSVLSARIAAKGSGRTLDDMNGLVRIGDAVYRYNDKEVRSDSLTLTGRNSARSKLVELRSDFADVTFRSKTSYREVFDYLQASAWRYLPLLQRGEYTGPKTVDADSAVDDFSLLSVDIRKINAIADAVSPGLQIADGSSMQLLFNPVSNQLSFRASSEYIERKKMLATRLNLNASNRGDSLVFFASAEDLYAGALHLPHLSVTGGAKEGLVQVSTGFNDTVRQLSGLLGVRAGVMSESGPNGRVVDLRILPSHITRGDKTWHIYAHRIQLDTAQVVIDKFYVMNHEQELLIDGVASRSMNDSVTLRLRNFDLAPFAQVADRMGYDIEGRTNGDATMQALLGGGEVRADITVDSLSVNGIAGPPLRLTSGWDIARNRARLAVVNRMKRDTLVRGYFAPDQMRYYARLDVDSLELKLLDPILSGVISSTEGLASANLVLQGRRREVDLSGRIRVKDLSTKVDFTQVRYKMPEAVLEVDGSRFRASNVTLYDEQGNPGRFDLDLNLGHLSNITYDVRVAPQHMLVLNTTSKDNDVFHGKVYATGRARISGNKAGVNMDIAATTDDNSSFFLPFSSKSNISNADFVTFEKPAEVDSTDFLAVRKQSFERKRKQKSASGGGMNISLALNVKPNVDVQLSISGNVIRARGDGTLNMQINPRAGIFEMYGDYAITEGSYLFSLQNIINKKFVIEPGSTIQWTGSPMNAMLDIQAIYNLKASLQPLLQAYSSGSDAQSSDRSVPVECIISLGSRLSNPSIGFEVRVQALDPETQALVSNVLNTPETVDMQFLYLLLFNNFMPEGSSGVSSGVSSVSAGSGLSFLANQLSSWLSTDDYNVVIRYRPKSDLTSDEVDFGLSKSLINNRLFVEVEGNYLLNDRQAVNKSMSNFMGEAYITYLIDRTGSLKLKAFTQTIDRFDENQGLQETGIGIYYKEDFNNFRDLRQRVRDRFSNKKRKERREARRAEKQRQRQAADTIRPLESVVNETQKENSNK